MKLSQLKAPFICLVISEPGIKSCLRIMDRFERGVDAFEVNLPPLNPAGLRDIFSSTPRPCIATNRRATFMRVYGYFDLPTVSEKSRAEALKRAVGLGAAAADFELDMFRTEPRGGIRLGLRNRLASAELSEDSETVKMQTGLAGEIKSAGAEAIISCHTQMVLREAEALKIVREVQIRGGQFAKIVSSTPHKEDLIEMLACAITLRRKAKIPFTMMNVGVGSSIGRLASLMAGSSWVYCRPQTEHSYGGQPTVHEARSFIQSSGLRV